MPFEPDLDEFWRHCMVKYTDVYYAKDDEDFKNNTKVKGQLLKDIWNKTTERDWLQ